MDKRHIGALIGLIPNQARVEQVYLLAIHQKEDKWQYTQYLPMPISINLLELLEKINQGYRPNKHDKNAVLLLDEVIEQTITVANEKNTLFILKNDKRYKVVNEDNEYFEVSGM